MGAHPVEYTVGIRMGWSYSIRKSNLRMWPSYTLIHIIFNVTKKSSVCVIINTRPQSTIIRKHPNSSSQWTVLNKVTFSYPRTLSFLSAIYTYLAYHVHCLELALMLASVAFVIHFDLEKMMILQSQSEEKMCSKKAPVIVASFETTILQIPWPNVMFSLV